MWERDRISASFFGETRIGTGDPDTRPREKLPTTRSRKPQHPTLLSIQEEKEKEGKSPLLFCPK